VGALVPAAPELRCAEHALAPTSRQASDGTTSRRARTMSRMM
jgi:hypothetical protein